MTDKTEKMNNYTKWLMNPEGFDPDKLDVNEFDQGDGRIIAKIPKMKDRIRIGDGGRVGLVVSRETDDETGEIREETVEIGGSISGYLPGMMVANDQYHDYFDTKGFLCNDPMRKQAPQTEQTRGHEAAGNEPEENEATRYRPIGYGPAGQWGSSREPDWTDVLSRANIEHTPMFNEELSKKHRELKGEKLKKRIEEELEKNNYIQLGEFEFVRFPDLPKQDIRILPKGENGLCPVEYIHERRYDKAKKQMRNRKTRIGYVIDELPGVLIPNRRYGDCFDESSGKSFDATIRETLANIRKNAEERKKKEEEERQRKAEEKRQRALFGENRDAEREAARMRLNRVIEKIYEEQDKAASEEDEEDRIEVIDVEQTDENDEEQTEINDEDNPDDPGDLNSEDEAEMQQGPTSHFPGISMEDERAAVLADILKAINEAIQVQAKKHPDALVNIYKARKINEILREVRIRYQNNGYDDLLELIEEPHEVEEDGQRHLTGMTYSDVEVLLCYYIKILRNVHLKSNK